MVACPYTPELAHSIIAAPRGKPVCGKVTSQRITGGKVGAPGEELLKTCALRSAGPARAEQEHQPKEYAQKDAGPAADMGNLKQGDLSCPGHATRELSKDTGLQRPRADWIWIWIWRISISNNADDEKGSENNTYLPELIIIVIFLQRKQAIRTSQPH
ncbi:hypothetical protein Q7P37_002341 [Cladosporium fusiforme]